MQTLDLDLSQPEGKRNYFAMELKTKTYAVA